MPYTSNPYAPKARMQARNDVVYGRRLTMQQTACKYGVNRSTIWRWVMPLGGEAFFTKPGDGIHTMRLNFTFPHEDRIPDAIGRLAETIKSSYSKKYY